MLGLVAAQLKYKVENKELKSGKAVWVDVSNPFLSVFGINANGSDGWWHWVSIENRPTKKAPV